MENFVGSFAGPCAPVRDIGANSIQVKDAPVGDLSCRILPNQSQQIYFQKEWELPTLSEHRDESVKPQPLMQRVSSKFRAGQGGWTVVNDEPSKPKDRVDKRSEVAAVECIQTHDFTVVADVGFANADGSAMEVQGGHVTRGQLPAPSAQHVSGKVLSNLKHGSGKFDIPADIFNKLYPMSANDMQHKIAGLFI